MPRQKASDIESRYVRQHEIDAMDIGETVSISRRIDLEFGISQADIMLHRQRLRGSLDQQAHRTRRKFRGKEFTVESVSAMTQTGALILTACCTRTL